MNDSILDHDILWIEDVGVSYDRVKALSEFVQGRMRTITRGFDLYWGYLLSFCNQEINLDVILSMEIV